MNGNLDACVCAEPAANQKHQLVSDFRQQFSFSERKKKFDKGSNNGDQDDAIIVQAPPVCVWVCVCGRGGGGGLSMVYY